MANVGVRVERFVRLGRVGNIGQVLTSFSYFNWLWRGSPHLFRTKELHESVVEAKRKACEVVGLQAIAAGTQQVVEIQA
jgi:hypothetical protein